MLHAAGARTPRPIPRSSIIATNSTNATNTTYTVTTTTTNNNNTTNDNDDMNNDKHTNDIDKTIIHITITIYINDNS